MAKLAIATATASHSAGSADCEISIVGSGIMDTAAMAVKKIMEREHMPGTIHLWPGIAE